MAHNIRNLLRFALPVAALFCVRVVGQDKTPDRNKVQIKVSNVSVNIYMIEGQGGNIAASVGEDGIVIVDDQFAGLAGKIQAALKELRITDKPVRFVINPHYNGAHTGGIVLFNNAGYTLIATDSDRTCL